MNRVIALVPLAYLLAVVLPASAQARAKADALERFNSLLAQMHEAYSHSEWKAYRTESLELVRLLNGSPDARLELARADARNGDSSAALRQLGTISRMGVSQAKARTLPDFSSLRNRLRFKRILRRMSSNAEPVSRSQRVLVVPDADLVPEDVAYDPRHREFLLTSVREARIVAIGPGGRMSTFARSPDSWPMLAIKIDARHDVLWATEVALTGFRSVPHQDWGRSAILEYALGTRRLLRRIDGPPDSQFGDMALSPTGDLLVSDSNGGGLYLIGRKQQHLTRLNTGDFVSPMTPAFVSEHWAFVADYVRGIALLNVSSGRVRWISMGKKYALEGTDGLYWYRGRLIAVQNGLTPERVISFTFDSRDVRISDEHAIESGTPDLDPTHGTIVAGFFYYIGHSGWNDLESDGTVRPGARLTPAVIMRARL